MKVEGPSSLKSDGQVKHQSLDYSLQIKEETDLFNSFFIENSDIKIEYVEDFNLEPLLEECEGEIIIPWSFANDNFDKKQFNLGHRDDEYKYMIHTFEKYGILTPLNLEVHKVHRPTGQLTIKQAEREAAWAAQLVKEGAECEREEAEAKAAKAKKVAEELAQKAKQEYDIWKENNLNYLDCWIGTCQCYLLPGDIHLKLEPGNTRLYCMYLANIKTAPVMIMSPKKDNLSYNGVEIEKYEDLADLDFIKKIDKIDLTWAVSFVPPGTDIQLKPVNQKPSVVIREYRMWHSPFVWEEFDDVKEYGSLIENSNPLQVYIGKGV